MHNIDISVKSPFHTQACLQVGKRTWDTPKHEEEVGRGPHEIRMFGRIVGAQSALQDIQWMSALQRPQWNEDTIRDITFDTQTNYIFLQL